MIPDRVHGLIRLLRVDLSAAAGVCVVLGALLAGDAPPPAGDLLLGFGAYFFLSATALVLNDYFDYAIDLINAPHRPLPAGLVTRGDVLGLAAVTALLGLAAGGAIGTGALAFCTGVWALGLLYNWKGKRAGIWGNLLVSTSVASSFVFGGIVAGHPASPLVWWFAALVFLFNLAEEIAADAFDVEGDRRAGSRSLAVVHGRRAALGVSIALFIGVTLVSLIPFALGWLRWWYAVPVAVMDAVILVSLLRLPGLPPEEGRRSVRTIYLTGLASLVAIVVIRVFNR